MIRPLRQAEMLERSQGCLLGQLAGDALGSLVEFQTPEQIRREYPNDVRELADGGTWNTIACQPTDDSEMALLLARLLADQGRYDPEEAGKVYLYRLDLLAHQYLGRADLWWIICDYNDIFFPMELEPGTVLRIPSAEHVNMRLLD